MGIKVTKNTLARFLERLGGQNVDNLVDRVANALAERGKEIAEGYYAGTHIEVVAEKADNGESRVVASGEGIAYMEFGTGLVGDGTYKGKLPSEPITFESPKGSKPPHTTNGWEYYYNNPKTKIMGGWFYGKTFTMGQPAQAQMFYTAKSLRENETEIVKNALKGDKSK